MEKVMSADGTSIAFEVFGAGDPVVLIGGALCDRASHRPLAQHLASAATAVTYDRRGRGDSGDTPDSALEREIGDLAAVIDAVGERAAVYGHSSGAALGLEAAAHGLPIDRLVLHEPPYGPDTEKQRQEAREYAAALHAVLDDGGAADAVGLFLSLVGTPAEEVERMRAEPWWPGMVALAPSLVYDSQAMGDSSRGGTLPLELVDRVTARTLVIVGGDSPEWMLDIGRQLASALPDGEHRVLDGQAHSVEPATLAPILTEFLRS